MKPEPDLTLSLPATAENVAVVRHALKGAAEALDAPADLIADIGLAVSEACANVVLHAYEEVPEERPRPLEVKVAVEGRKMRVAVMDRGQGMRPRAISDGLGLGLPLMTTLSEGLELRSVPEGGTEVTLKFDLGGAMPSVDGWGGA